MAEQGLVKMVEQVRHQALRHQDGGLTDSQLLEAFLARRDEAAFEALVWRHAAMVLGVCRRVIGNCHDAEDAFQATFLVLVRKAATLQQQGLVGNWLHGVAYRTALKAKTQTARRHGRELPLPEEGPSLPSDTRPDPDDLHRLDQELQRLPAKYREPLVLCELEQRSRKDVAQHLGLPEGTLSSRLATGRKLLARRLTASGVSSASLAILTPAIQAHVPVPLVVSTVNAATASAAGKLAVGAVSATVATLQKEVLHAMWISQCKQVGSVIAVTLCACLLLGGFLVPMLGAQPAPQQPFKPASSDPLSASHWGQIIDPAKDVTFTFIGNQVKMKIPDGDHALCIESNRMNAPRILQEVNGDFILQVRVAGKVPQGARSVVERRLPFHSAGLLLFADEKNYIRLERAELISDGKNLRYGSFELRRNGALERIGDGNEMPLDQEDVFLRLERRGDKVFGSISADGAQWQSFPPIECSLPNKVQVGIIAGHNTSSGFETTFSGLKLFADVDVPQDKWLRGGLNLPSQKSDPTSSDPFGRGNLPK